VIECANFTESAVCHLLAAACIDFMAGEGSCHRKDEDAVGPVVEDDDRLGLRDT